eukprot:gene24362-29447_t
MRRSKLIWVLFSVLVICFAIPDNNDFIQKQPNNELRCIRNLEIQTETERQVVASSNQEMLMRDKEKILLYRNLLNASVYFEYGCGGSTELACANNPNLEIHSIDTSDHWIKAVKENKCIQEGIEKQRVHMTWVDIGELTSFGYPATEAKKHQWPHYSESIKKLGGKVDFVLIDGRFRVASFLKSLLYTNSSKTKIAVHDFFYRPPYYGVLKYADVVDCQDQLIILQGKPHYDQKELLDDLHAHQYAGL